MRLDGMPRLLLDPDPEGVGGGMGSNVETTNQSVETQSYEAPQQGTTVSAATQREPEVGQQPQEQNGGWTSIRDAARNYGVDLSSFNDDASALAYLANQANRARDVNRYEQLNQQLVQGLQGLQGQFQPQQQQQPERQPWEAPTVDQRYFALVQRDPETGVILPKFPGVDPRIVQQVSDYVQWHENFQQNPAAAIQPLVEQRAQELARQTVQEELRQQQQATAVQQIVSRNAQWMFATDESGRQIRRPDGNPVPTPAGARYITHLRTLASSGMTDPVQQDYYARQMVRNEIFAQIAAQQGGQQQPGQVQQQQVQQQQRRVRASGHPNRNSAQAAGPARQAEVPGGTAPDNTGKSLQQMMREAFRRDGVSIDDAMV